jgi:hypothetical protein
MKFNFWNLHGKSILFDLKDLLFDLKDLRSSTPLDHCLALAAAVATMAAVVVIAKDRGGCFI